jgi:hypothetical protein
VAIATHQETRFGSLSDKLQLVVSVNKINLSLIKIDKLKFVGHPI